MKQTPLKKQEQIKKLTEIIDDATSLLHNIKSKHHKIEHANKMKSILQKLENGSMPNINAEPISIYK